MDHFRAPQIDSIGVTIRKKRSQTLRRPRPEPHSLPDRSSMSPTQLSDDTSKISSDEIGDVNSRGKMFNLNQCASRPFSSSGSDGGSNALDSNGVSGDGMGNENKLKKVKLKVGGVTRTIQTDSNSNVALGTSNASSAKANQSFDSRQRQKLILQEHSDEYHSPAQDKKKGIPWKGFSKGDFRIGKEDKGGMPAKNSFEKQGEKLDPIRKSRRMPRKRVLDEEFDEDDQDDEIRYLEKLKTAKIAGYKDTRTDSTRKQRKDGKSENIEGTGKSGRDFKKSRPKDVDYEEEEESDGEPEGKTKKKQKKDLSDLPSENKRELTLTTRQRALLSKDDSSASGASQIEFPNGLPPAPPRKQKEELSEMEQQLKKAEIAQRRKMQNEKAARESEAEAIRRILGQDSSRKKREDKVKKRQEELAQEKAASAQMLASSTIRWVMGPTGTTVIFPQEMGFPKIFESKLCSYPPPREKCAGPSCTNSYKYRDSKSKLPLCSLQCYKAIHEKMLINKAC